eukprot:1027989-Amphidinium_carterae.1
MPQRPSWGDREVVQAAMQKNPCALCFAADRLLEDPTFAMEAKTEVHLLKLVILSGRSTVVAAPSDESIEDVLDRCHERLGLADDGATLELWHGSETVPARTNV